ncbi:MAG: outer membrane beta-barrel protein [Prolixibacteraceae bacterium]|nr:outer membrane beta-barrel protein [Prolixibacteraceae bacterium]
MKKSVLTAVALMALVLVIPSGAKAQNSVKVRLSGSYPFNFKESDDKEIVSSAIGTVNEEFGPFSSFSHDSKFGFNAEAMLSISENFWIGAEFGLTNLTGKNGNPPLYNFQYTDFYQLKVSIPEVELVDLPLIGNTWRNPLEYETSIMDILASFRYYVLPVGKIRPFAKVHGGVSMISTELRFQNSVTWPPTNYSINVAGTIYTGEDLAFSAPVLYSAGKNGSKRETALNLGGGVGLEVMLTDRISLYADATYSWIMSDILDGKPDFDYYETVDEEGIVIANSTRYNRKNVNSSLMKASIGLCFTFGDFNLFGNRSGGGTYGNSNNPYLPFSPPRKR